MSDFTANNLVKLLAFIIKHLYVGYWFILDQISCNIRLMRYLCLYGSSAINCVTTNKGKS